MKQTLRYNPQMPWSDVLRYGELGLLEVKPAHVAGFTARAAREQDDAAGDARIEGNEAGYDEGFNDGKAEGLEEGKAARDPQEDFTAGWNDALTAVCKLPGFGKATTAKVMALKEDD